MKAKSLIPSKEFRELKSLHEEVNQIKGNVKKILFILEDEGEVNKGVLKELGKAKNAPKKLFFSHEDVKKVLMK